MTFLNAMSSIKINSTYYTIVIPSIDNIIRSKSFFVWNDLLYLNY